MARMAPLASNRLCGELQQAITALAWSPDGEFLAIASAGGELLLLDFRAGCEELLRGSRDSSLDVLDFSSDGQFLVAAGQSGELLLWELGGTGIRPMAMDPIPLGCGWIDTVAWQPRGLQLAVAANSASGMGPAGSGAMTPSICRAQFRRWPGVLTGCSWQPVARAKSCCGDPASAGRQPAWCATPSLLQAWRWRFQGRATTWPAA